MRLPNLLLPAALFIFSIQLLDAQTLDNIGSGRAIVFDGVDDYIDFGDIYSNLSLPFTISAWVYLDPASTSPAPIFSNRNCDPVYTGFRLIINANVISLEYGDGLGGNSSSYRRGKQATVDLLKGSWNHITAVVRDVSDMDLYLNGINVGGTFTGTSGLKMDSSKPGFASSAYFISNGVVYRFKGAIDEIRLWNKALNEIEVRSTMCVMMSGNEPGLVGYWNFNETTGNIVHDKSPNHFDGIFKGNPVRVFSGAPMGDMATCLYSPSMTGKSVTITEGDYTVTAKNISDLSGGVHMYLVRARPSQTLGLDMSEINKPYFGVFLAKQNAASTFDAKLISQNGSSCGLYSRKDNGVATWGVKADVSSEPQRLEMVFTSGLQSVLDLGVDQVVCDQNSYLISTGITDPQFSFEWNNAETTSSILATQSGIYTVKVSGGCGVVKDSVAIKFLQAPQQFSLGEDVKSCKPEGSVLSPITDRGAYTFLWQDGSTNATYRVNDFGEYWLSVKNACGEVSDTVVFSKKDYPNYILPNVITPNSDGKNDFFKVNDELIGLVSLRVINRWGQEVYLSEAYSNDWDATNLSSGTYFIILDGNCIKKSKDILYVMGVDN